MSKGVVMFGRLFLSLLAGGLLLSGCATNPVTGEREMGLVSESMELETGNKQYGPSRQMQGGDFKLDPALVKYVSGVGERIAKVSDRKLPYEFVVINDSTPNAWALPGGKIAVNRGLLLELDNEAELAAVLAHEIVHAAARHGAKGMERGILLKGAVLAAGVAARDSDYSQLAVGAAAVGANLLNQRHSRGAELEADAYGMRYMHRAGYDPQAAVGLQETFVRLNKERKSNWLSGLFASHPPSQERVEKNREMAQELGAGGELGRARYQQRTAYLHKIKPAYTAYEEGRKALKEKQTDKALRLAEKAIAIEPREALFHGLKGDVLASRKSYRSATRAYDKAIRYDRNFFKHYLRRGLVRSELGDKPGARSDLEKSLKLLPTANAHHALGQISLNAGDRQGAIKHFRSASSSGSDVGKASARALARIELPRQPGRYIRASLGVSSGKLVIKIGNASPVKVKNLRLSLVSPGGKREIRLNRTVASGKGVNVGTNITVPKGSSLKGWRVSVIRAAVAE
ncbi:MAG: M48 family metalloprotease [Candidatus Sedimenticola sp. 20ELBAFRAG]